MHISETGLDGDIAHPLQIPGQSVAVAARDAGAQVLVIHIGTAPAGGVGVDNKQGRVFGIGVIELQAQALNHHVRELPDPFRTVTIAGHGKGTTGKFRGSICCQQSLAKRIHTLGERVPGH